MKPINLNQKRKERARAEKKARADANAVKFGRSKAHKAASETSLRRDAAKLDHHRLDRDAE